MSSEKDGKIITFYSYKGGTGRSMALANVAWILASNGKQVLMLDWDLEAPGLHRYFSPFLFDKDLTDSEGIVDFVSNYAAEAVKPSPEGEKLPDDWYLRHADILRYAVSVEWEFPNGGALDFVPAGRQGPAYAARVNSFNWQNFYERLGGEQFLEAAKKQMRKEYDYILVDSRTGVSDTAGICTVQMPDTLVVCLTLNNQSIEGASAVARSVFEQRRKQPANSGFRIFPVPTRVEKAEQDKMDSRRRYARRKFDPFLDYLTTEDECKSYWLEVQIPYIPYFAFEEILAPFKEELSDPLSLLGAIMRLTSWLTERTVTNFSLLAKPGDRERIVSEFARTPEQATAEGAAPGVSESEAETQVRLAETAFARFAPEDRLLAQRIFTRLVRVTRPEDGGERTKLGVRLKELGAAVQPLVQTLVVAQLLVTGRETEPGDAAVEIASEALIRHWPRLHEWVEGDLDFLVWRLKLRGPIQDWEKSGRKSDFLLRGAPLKEAQDRLNTRRADLNEAEIDFINQATSLEAQAQRPIYSRAEAALRAFIIRPFGTKKDRNQNEVNFDAVQEQLIVPAVERVGVDGRTTLDILRAGNIRADMFQRLLTADLIIADLTIDNANVFYELGIRHALREKRTFMLRCEGDKYPFDLQTDRYFIYQRENPAASLEQLVAALRQTLNSEEQDSPVFKLLPNLEAQERSRFLNVPMDFREEVEQASANRQAGDLELLGVEAGGLDWESEGLRVLGRAQFRSRAFKGARATWEAVRKFDPKDREASTVLGTIYQRLGDLTRSDQALRRVLERKDVASYDRAEVHALLGRNGKVQWKADWERLPTEQQRQRALRSGFLEDVFKAYAGAFNEDLNHYYSGLNALGLLTIEIELAAALPEVWGERFDEPADAPRQLDALRKQAEKLSAAVGLCLQATLDRLEREGIINIWVEISEAELCFLTAKRPARVISAYHKALDGADDFAVEAARSQIVLCQQLGILGDNVKAALSVFAPSPAEAGAPQGEKKNPRVLLFTGHRVDEPGRETPRFPADKESVARQAIKHAVAKEIAEAGEIAFGIAGGASGGDILFHEVCAELGIPTKLYLALPPDQFIKASVRPAGPQWIERFWRLRERLPERVLAESEKLPRWLQEKPNYSIWQRDNLWMLYNALAAGGDNVTLIALWNGESGDGPGGTADLVEKAKERRAKPIILYTEALFGLSK